MTPEFHPAGYSVSGTFGNSIDGTLLTRMTLKPSQHGYEIIVQVNAHYTATGVAEDGPPLSDFSNNCLDIQTPQQNGYNGDSIEEYALKTQLRASGPNVTGTLTYAAILPGSYSFDLECVGTGGQVNMGSVTTANLGTAYGSSTDNEMVVFAERKSATDMVILYGAVGGTQDGSDMHPETSSCISNQDLSNAGPRVWHPSGSRTDRRVVGQYNSGNRQWYEFGSLTFPIAGSRTSGYQFYYGCNGGSTFVSLY